MADFRSQRSVWSTLTQYQFLLPCVCSKQVSFSLPQSLEISKYRIFSVQSVWISKALRVNFLFHIIFFVSFGSKPFCCSLPLNPPTNVILYVSHISAICIRLHILVMMMMSLSSPVQWSLRRGPLSSFLQEVLRIWFLWMNLRV